MVPVPTSYLNVPVFGSGAAVVQPEGSTYAGGFLPGQLFPAEYENWLMNRLTTNSLASQTTNLSVAAEIVNVLSQASITPDPASTTQLYAALNALYATVGALSSEASTRASADTTLQSNINAEANTRANADTTLTNTKAPIASPTFTGTPAAPTPSSGDNSTTLATTAFVHTLVSAIPAQAVSLVGFQNTTVSGSTNVSSMSVGELRFIFFKTTGGGSISTPTAAGVYLVLAPSSGAVTQVNLSASTVILTTGSGGSVLLLVFRQS